MHFLLFNIFFRFSGDAPAVPPVLGAITGAPPPKRPHTEYAQDDDVSLARWDPIHTFVKPVGECGGSELPGVGKSMQEWEFFMGTVQQMVADSVANQFGTLHPEPGPSAVPAGPMAYCHQPFTCYCS